jgi:hypothetical protein
LLSLPVELTHHSLGDGLSDGGRTVTGRANDIIARLSSAADSGCWSLTCLYHLHVIDLACTLKASELSLERLLSPSDKAQLPSPTHLTQNHALIFHISDRNYTAMHTHVQWSVHLSALLITRFT